MHQISDFYGIYMFLEVIKAKYLDGYRLRLIFNNGEMRDADLQSSLKGEIFVPLLDIEMFKRFSVRFNTIVWENEADFAPEYLYEISSPVTYDYDKEGKPQMVTDGSTLHYKA